jgi:hypothetical protein
MTDLLVLDRSLVTSDPSPHETGRQPLDYYELAVRVSAGRQVVAILLSCAKNSSEARTF